MGKNEREREEKKGGVSKAEMLRQVLLIFILSVFVSPKNLSLLDTDSSVFPAPPASSQVGEARLPMLRLGTAMDSVPSRDRWPQGRSLP